MDIQQKHATDVIDLKDIFAHAKNAFWVYNMFLRVFQINVFNNFVFMHKVKSQNSAKNILKQVPKLTHKYAISFSTSDHGHEATYS